MQRVYNGYAEVRARSTWVNYYIMPIYFSCRTFRRHREYVTFHCFICDVFDRIQNTVKSESIYLYCINSLHNVDDEYFVHSVMQVLSVVELFVQLNKPQQTCRVYSDPAYHKYYTVSKILQMTLKYHSMIKLFPSIL